MGHFISTKGISLYLIFFGGGGGGGICDIYFGVWNRGL